MKNLILFITITCISQIANAQMSDKLPTTSLKDLKLRGHVKEVVDSGYVGELLQVKIDTMHVYYTTTMKFDEKGNETGETTQYGDKTLNSKSSYNYIDKKTLIVNRTSTDSKFFDISIFKYNENGKKIECDYSANFIQNDVPDTTFGKYIYKYDTINKRTEVAIQRKDTVENEKIIFLFNDKHENIETDIYNSRGILYYKTVSYYDRYGNKTKSENYLFGQPTGGNTSTYNKVDHNGNWKLKISQDYLGPNSTGGVVQKEFIKRTIIYY